MFIIDKEDEVMFAGTDTKINWRNSVAEALNEAKRTGKVVLLDFFNPG